MFLSVLFPKEEKVSFLENISPQELYERIPFAEELPDQKFKALFQYRNTITKNAIWEIKYRGNNLITKTFSLLLYEFILENMIDVVIFSNFTHPLLVSIPQSKMSKNEKGFNQSELITEMIYGLDNGKNFDLCIHGIKKIRETKHQSKIKNRTERLKNLHESFNADPSKIMGRNIILIDDVITTGATMYEAEKALYEAGAKKVIGFAIAH